METVVEALARARREIEEGTPVEKDSVITNEVLWRLSQALADENNKVKSSDLTRAAAWAHQIRVDHSMFELVIAGKVTLSFGNDGEPFFKMRPDSYVPGPCPPAPKNTEPKEEGP